MTIGCFGTDISRSPAFAGMTSDKYQYPAKPDADTFLYYRDDLSAIPEYRIFTFLLKAECVSRYRRQ
jgi:hypothetical protein